MYAALILPHTKYSYNLFNEAHMHGLLVTEYA